MKLLGVSQPTLSAWEGERKSPSIDKLELMADVYKTSTDYLLGCTELLSPATFNPVLAKNLLILHGKLVWSPTLEWLLVNSIECHLILTDEITIPFTATGKLYMMPPNFSEPVAPRFHADQSHNTASLYHLLYLHTLGRFHEYSVSAPYNSLTVPSPADPHPIQRPSSLHSLSY